MTRSAPAGDFDYERHGGGYTVRRQPDPRIAALLHRALGEARTVLNVGAGAGSYEPRDRYVVAVEPSAAMRAQRPPELVPAIDVTAERLPFDAAALDDFWLRYYVPEVIAVEQRRFPAISSIVRALGGTAEVLPVPIPRDCTDGFGEAYYARPRRSSTPTSAPRSPDGCSPTPRRYDAA